MGTCYWTNAVSFKAKRTESAALLRAYIEQKREANERQAHLSDDEMHNDPVCRDDLRWATPAQIRGWASERAESYAGFLAIEDEELFLEELFATEQWSISVDDQWIRDPHYSDQWKHMHDVSYMDVIASEIISGSFIECESETSDGPWRYYWVNGREAEVVNPQWIVPG